METPARVFPGWERSVSGKGAKRVTESQALGPHKPSSGLFFSPTSWSHGLSQQFWDQWFIGSIALSQEASNSLRCQTGQDPNAF